MSEKLSNAMAELEEEKVNELVADYMAKGVPALEILAGLQSGMDEVGRRFASKEYFLSELIMSGDIFKTAVEALGDAFSDSAMKLGKIVIGTVKDDIHDIGKDIAATLLACNGFDVIDIGIDVPAEKFIEAIKEHNPEIIGMSCLLTSCFESMKSIVEAIDEAGLREGRKLIIGGGIINQTVADYVKADAFTNSAQEAVGICKNFLQ